MLRQTILALAAIAGPAAAQDWQGAYAGFSGGALTNGSWTHYDPTPFNDGPYKDGSAAGAFAGFNLQTGNVVYGGELAYSSAHFRFSEYPAEGIKDMTELKARVGYAMGKALFYGSAGLAQATYFDGGEDLDLDGTRIGLGLDYRITDRFFVGGEIARYDVDGDLSNPPIPGFTTKHHFTSVSLRIGMTF